MLKFEKLSRAEMKNVVGGNMPSTSCSADCPVGEEASISNCVGTCTGTTGSCTCTGSGGAVLTKTCKKK